MASQNVTVVLTVAQAKAVADLLAVNAALKKVGGSMDSTFNKANQKGKGVGRGFDAVNSTINRAVKSFLSLSMGMRAFGKLASLIVSELQKVKEFRMLSADAQATFGQTIKKIIKILPPSGSGLQDMGDQPALAIKRRAIAYANKPGVMMKPTEIAELYLSSVSGGVTQKVSERLDTAEAIAPYVQEFEKEDVPTVAQIVQMTRETYGVSGKDAIATLFQAMSTSQITDIQKIAKNMMTGAMQLHGMGYDLESATETMVGAQVATKDPTGRMSRTMALANIGMTYEKFGKQYGLEGRGIEEFMRAQGRFGPGTKDHEAAMAWNKRLQGGALDKDITDRMTKRLAGGTGAAAVAIEASRSEVMGRAAIKASYKQFIAHTPKKEMQKTIESVAESITPASEAFVELEARNKPNAATMVWDLRRRREAMSEAFALADDASGVSGEILKYLQGPVAAKVGLSGGAVTDPLEKWKEMLRANRGDVAGSLDAYIGLLSGQKFDVEKKAVYPKKGPWWEDLSLGLAGGGGDRSKVRYRARTSLEMLKEDPSGYAVAEALRAMIAELKVFRVQAVDQLDKEHAARVRAMEGGTPAEPPVPTNQASINDVIPERQ